MKYLLIFFLLVTVLITAGCVNENKNVVITPTQMTTSSSIPTPTPAQTIGRGTSIVGNWTNGTLFFNIHEDGSFSSVDYDGKWMDEHGVCRLYYVYNPEIYSVPVTVTSYCIYHPLSDTLTLKARETSTGLEFTRTPSSAISPSITTFTLSDSFVMPTDPNDVTEQNYNRILMDCKNESNFGYPFGYSPTPICIRAYHIYISINRHVPPNPYEARGDAALKLLHCIQGVGTLEDCYVIGEQNGMDRATMKKMWCETNPC